MTSSVYNYVNKAKVWLPMTAECHDPVNVRTLDVSGNGLHFRFGDGVTANTFPTKLAARGYSYDGSNDYFQALVNQTNAITEATWAVFYMEGTPLAGVEYVYGHNDAVNVRAIILSTSTTLQFYCGDIVNALSLSVVPIPGQLSFIAGRRTTDGFRRLYYNGVNGTPNNAGTSLPSTIVAGPPRIGASYVLGGPLSGRVLWYGHWEYALSEIQLRDLEARLRRQINDV